MSFRPGATFRLPAPPTTRYRGTPAAFTAPMRVQGSLPVKRTALIAASCPASRAAKPALSATSPRLGVTPGWVGTRSGLRAMADGVTAAEELGQQARADIPGGANESDVHDGCSVGFSWKP